MPPLQRLFLSPKFTAATHGDGRAWLDPSHVTSQCLCSTQHGPVISRVLPQYKYLSIINNYDQVSWVTAHSK